MDKKYYICDALLEGICPKKVPIPQGMDIAE